MGNMRQVIKEGVQVRALIYGEDKTRKTTWAGRAAAAGFNCLFLDTDAGPAVLKSTLDDAALDRITYIDIQDDFVNPVGAHFIGFLLRGKPFIWDISGRKVATIIGGSLKREEGKDYIYIAPRKMSVNDDVIIFDSYTRICNSLVRQYALENDIDVTSSKTPWDGYQWAGHLASEFLGSLMSLPCSVIVAGHQQRYEEKDKMSGNILSSKVYPSSVSGPHSAKVGAFFSDVLYANTVGLNCKIDTRTGVQAQCGCKMHKPANYDWDALQFKDIAEHAGLKPTGGEPRGWVIIPAAMSSEELLEKTGMKVYSGGGISLGATAQTAIKSVETKPLIIPKK